MNSRTTRPARDEAAEYYFKYIDLVPAADVCAILEQQLDTALTFLRAIPPNRAQHRYAPDKWSVNGVVAHVNDCERLFAFRAFWFARGFDSALPSFDQHTAAGHDGADDRPLSTHIAEFESVRRASLALFSHLPLEAWSRRGIASDNPFTVRALAFIAAGHVIHHSNILRELYLQ
jgi:DinB superfamily